MGYSLKKIADNPASFPPPMTWMTWVEDFTTKSKVVGHTDTEPPRPIYDTEHIYAGEGKIKHFYTLALAKRSLSWFSRDLRRYAWGYSEDYLKKYSGKFRTNWAIYEWVDGEWIERFRGAIGEDRQSNPLYRIKIDKEGRVHPLDKIREQEALEAIQRSLRNVVA